MTDAACPLCTQTVPLTDYIVAESPSPTTLAICETCHSSIARPEVNPEHWSALTDTMWSEKPAVQVTAYRLLSRLSQHAWAQDALDMLYLDDETKVWAEAGLTEIETSNTRDSNGALLYEGDNVTLIKDLPVKGAGFTAKRGTLVRGISLTDNPEHVEGRVKSQRIVLVSAYLKKA